ncbi:MAG: hypothetical protein VYC67_01525 [Pseudomonadota bacterium]|nr:hypothetical protein [Pseudomonadota bacterium]
MQNIPIKKYLLRRFTKWLKKLLVTEDYRVKRLVKSWRKSDISPLSLKQQSTHRGINQHESSLFSQNGEDGIIRYIFSVIGFESRYFVEFGFGAHQCNALRLMLHENFKGLLMDGSEEQCRIFNRGCKEMQLSNVIAVNAFIDVTNLQKLIVLNGVPDEIDFLSIDVDGNDYWLWEVLDCINPRVVCIEYNSGIGPDDAWSTPYSADFERFAAHPSGFFAGASLKALESLGQRKGYRLVACDSTGTNAFFIRKDINSGEIITLSSKEAFYPHLNWLSRGITEKQQLEIMRSLPYVEV